MVVSCADFDYTAYFKNVKLLKRRRGNQGKNKEKLRDYLNLVTAFDIETTRIPGMEQSVMYIWQWAFEDTVVVGRTWEEFLSLQHHIQTVIPADSWIVVYVHNLPFEFQYLKGIYSFVPEDIFAVDSRKVVKADMHGCYELRCSYKLTNMSLAQFTEKFHVKHTKLSGEDFDYSKERYWFTPLTDQEIAYCVHDVLGLVEALHALMDRDGDTLYTIPLTSTGYIRRMVKRSMKAGKEAHWYVSQMLPGLELYQALREAFRGGNTHASRYFANDVIYNVHSADRSSSYPAILCNSEFPVSLFVPFREKDCTWEYVWRCLTIRHKALLLRIAMSDVELRDPYWGCPYLSTDKCRIPKSHRLAVSEDNGRILSAAYIETTITDVDLRIILREYRGKIKVLQGWYASYGKLPQSLTDVVITLYKQKTELKGVDGQEVYYEKSKNLLNACYGMMAQSVHRPVIFQQKGEYKPDMTKTDAELLEEYNKKAFLCYQWGVWCTCWGRFHLELGIRNVHDQGGRFIYCDTDSVKYYGDHVSWDAYNDDRIDECLKSGAYATDPKGRTHYMGTFELEDKEDTGYAYAEFKTLGAKKYAFRVRSGEPVKCTIAGVGKHMGGMELDARGGLDAFEDGFVFWAAGGQTAVYNDDPQLEPIYKDGHRIDITSNLTLMPSTYKLGITGEYERIIAYSKIYLDNKYVI